MLNHAAERLLAERDADFLARPDRPTLETFVERAISASAGGRRGDFGGSILYSHAFDDPALPAMYRARFGDGPLKPQVRCLVWKDSMRVQRRLMASQGHLQAIMERLGEVKFLLPVRHPLDCAASNLRTGHARHLGAGAADDFRGVLHGVLAALRWGLELNDRWPGRTFVFTQAGSASETAAGLADFLGVGADRQWIEDFKRVFRVREPGQARPAGGADLAREMLAPWPGILAAFPDLDDR